MNCLATAERTPGRRSLRAPCASGGSCAAITSRSTRGATCRQRSYRTGKWKWASSVMLLCRRLRLPSERTCSEGGGINCCCWDGPAGKRLFLPVCGSPALAADSSTERQRQPALSHKRCYWENQWLTGIAGVFCTGEERKKGKALEQSSHIVPVLNFANHLHML